MIRGDSMSKWRYVSRVTELTVTPEHSTEVFGEHVTVVKIDDEGGGEFVIVQQHPDDPRPGMIQITPGEWPALREAIDQLVAACRDSETAQEKC